MKFSTQSFKGNSSMMLKEGIELMDGIGVGLGLAMADSNNNNSSKEKSYSLRPRNGTKKDDETFENYDTWKPRGRCKKRLKQKPQPLSKYRRKTANARERSRMREINEAFEALRRIIPHLSLVGENNSEKLTKISTLRSAMKYISALRRVLQEPYEHGDSDGDGESLLSDCGLTPRRILRDHDLTSSFEEHSLTASVPFSDHILASSFDLDDSVGSLGGPGGFASPSHTIESPYQNSCFSTSNFHDQDLDPDSDLDPDQDSTQQLIDSNLTSTVFDSCLDVPVFGSQFS